jgi:alkylation response protein AidB-like acyl-CoA dehydrogenase
MRPMSAIPETPRRSYWEAEPELGTLLGRLLPAATFEMLRPRLEAMGRIAAEEVADLAAVADREGPKLQPRDPRGERIDRVVYHPAYHRMEEIAYGAGIVALKYDPAVRRDHGAHAHVMGFSLGYLFSQADSGLFCPVCMTDGVARVIEKHGTPRMRARVLPHLVTTRRADLWQGAMFLTEKGGGSDVGAATGTIARRDGDGWRLHGEKWFCSNVDAEAILALARPEGAPGGTSGLGLFLVTDRSGVVVHRLKEKLGVRSMPTGEVTFEGAAAEVLGGPGEGFKQMADMISLSRLYNAVASVACMRRALHEALHWARNRTAFGRTVATHPLARARLAEIAAEQVAALHLVLRTAADLDRADGGDEAAAARVRILTPLAKYACGKLAVWAASECIEIVGGNGYIEDWPLARILRDAQVLPVWEGTSNIQILDVLRASLKGDADRALLWDLAGRGGEVEALRSQADALRGLEGSAQQIAARVYADALAREAAATFAAGSGTEAGAAAARRLRSAAAPGAIAPLSDGPDSAALLGG